MKTLIWSPWCSSALLTVVTLLCSSKQAAADDPRKPQLSGKRIESIKDRAKGKTHDGQILRLTNEFRMQNGAPLLQDSSALNTIATRYAALMAEKDQLGHNLDGKDVGKRMSAAGYLSTSRAENIAWSVGRPDSYSAAVECFVPRNASG